MKLVKKKITLGEFTANKDMYLRLYDEVRDFNRALFIEENVLESIETIVKVHDQKLKSIQEKLQKNLEGKEVEEKETLIRQANAAYIKMLNEEIEFNMAVISKDDIKPLNFNAHQLRILREFIEREEPSNPEEKED